MNISPISLETIHRAHLERRKYGAAVLEYLQDESSLRIGYFIAFGHGRPQHSLQGWISNHLLPDITVRCRYG